MGARFGGGIVLVICRRVGDIMDEESFMGEGQLLSLVMSDLWEDD